MTDLTITPVDKTDELFCEYDGQMKPQDCYIALNLEDGQMWADYNAEIGGQPASVFHRRTLRWTIPVLTADVANRLMNDIAPLAHRVLAGSEIDWDGHNHVGHLDDDAQAAADEISELCDPQNGTWDETSQVCAMDAYDWTLNMVDETIERLGLTADATDAELADMESKEIAYAAELDGSSYGHIILTGFGDWLRSKRDEMRDDIGDELAQTVEKIAALEADRDAAIRRLATWGWSSRTIGNMVGRSHMWVQRLLAEETAAGDDAAANR